ELARGDALSTPVDPESPGRPSPDRSIDSRLINDPADMTSNGFPRDNIKGWELWIEAHPEQLSQVNQDLIQGRNPRTGQQQAPRSPKIDNQWLEYFPEHATYQGEDLWLHHAQWMNPETGAIENGPYLQAVPKPTHLGNDAHWHGNLG